MISVQEAEKIILARSFRPEKEQIDSHQALGSVLGSPISTDRPFPPYNRVTMDGIAIATSAFENGQRSFQKQTSQFAGEPQATLINSVDCIETATGAILPQGCDAVIPYEHLSEEHGSFTFKDDCRFKPQQNVHRKGSDFDVNTVVVNEGTLLEPTHLVIAASIGATDLTVYKKLTVAVVSTGDELVDVASTPKDHQVRRSNNVAIEASLPASLCTVSSFHLDDDEAEMKEWLAVTAPQFDILIFSGGVSMGKKDYLPRCLKAHGVEELFHKIAQRPGKPMWFGSKANQVVFGMPGNPVSTHFCTLRYAMPFIQNCHGIDTKRRSVTLGQSVSFAPNLTLFKPVVLDEATATAIPIHTNGSGDFISLGKATGFIELPNDQSEFEAGTLFTYYPFT